MVVVIDFILIVVIVKHYSEGSQIFHFNSSEAKQHSERSQRFHFLVTYVKEIVFQWVVLQQQ